MGKVIQFPKKEEQSMLDVLDVAKFFLRLGPMKHKKLQKLCYYAQAWYMVFVGRKLIDTDFEAWVHGPVSPRLYEKYKEWNGLTIPQITYELYNLNIQDNIQEYLVNVYNLYKNYSADELELLTHMEQPWIEARGNLPPKQPCKNVINNDTIKKFYQGVINK